MVSVLNASEKSVEPNFVVSFEAGLSSFQKHKVQLVFVNDHTKIPFDKFRFSAVMILFNNDLGDLAHAKSVCICSKKCSYFLKFLAA